MTGDEAGSFLKNFDAHLAQWTILIICVLMLGGGLLVFYFRLWSRNQRWQLEWNQVIGTIFFFPTLILLAVYLNMSKDAVIGILGAFLGSLFARQFGGGGQGSPGQSSPTTDTTPTGRTDPRTGPTPQGVTAGGSFAEAASASGPEAPRGRTATGFVDPVWNLPGPQIEEPPEPRTAQSA